MRETVEVVRGLLRAGAVSYQAFAAAGIRPPAVATPLGAAVAAPPPPGAEAAVEALAWW